MKPTPWPLSARRPLTVLFSPYFHIFQAHIFSSADRLSYWYLNLLESINGFLVVLITASGFSFRFSATISIEIATSWISGVTITCVCVNQLLLHPGRKVIPVLRVEQSLYQRKHLTNEATTPGYLLHIRKKQVVQVMSYLKSRSSSTYWMKRLLCTTDYNGRSNGENSLSIEQFFSLINYILIRNIKL